MATGGTTGDLHAAAPGTAGWTPIQVTVVAICAVINMLDGMDVLIISYIAPAMAKDWGVSFEVLGVIFSAGLVGMMLGSIVIAPLADGIGRRPVVLGALMVITAGAFGTGLAQTIPAFVGFRFLTGLGIGTLLASVAALASEYAPPGKRSIAIGWFQAGYPIGAVLTGLVSIWSIPQFGWQATLLGTAVVSAVVLPFAFMLLPESLDLLQNRQPAGALAKINALRLRLDLPQLDNLPPPRSRGAVPKLGHLFAGGLWKSTLILWLSIFLGYLVLYFVTSWIPRLASEAGLSAANSLWAGSVFNVGGIIGTTSIGWLIRGYMLVGAVLLVVFSQPMPLVAVLGVAVGMGLAVQGGFSGFYSLAAQIYPTEVRSSGIGWAIGIGRGGSVIGPLLGGFLLGQHLPLWIVFLCFAIPLALSGMLAALVRGRADLA
jgi:benzoate transport